MHNVERLDSRVNRSFRFNHRKPIAEIIQAHRGKAVRKQLLCILAFALLACSDNGSPPGTLPPTNDTTARPSAGCGNAMEAGVHVFTLNHGGTERTYDLMIPSDYVSTEPMPLLLNLHPLTLGGPWLHTFWAWVSNLNAKGDREGFLVAQPDGTGAPVSWNGGEDCCSPPGTDVDDVDFIAAVIDAVQNQICVDERRVVATGMSNGAYLAYRIACEAPDMLAAIAPVVGSLSAELDCLDGRAIPVLQLSGSEDSLDRRELSVTRFLEINGCNDTTEITYRQGDVTCTTHPACEEDVEVTHCIVDGGGHCFFGDSDFLLSLAGCEVRDDIVSQDLIWEFLSRWRLP